MNLKKARQEDNLEGFIKEHEKEAPADKERLEKTIDSLVQGKSKSTQETSQKSSSES